jgi:hypothetical protein
MRMQIRFALKQIGVFLKLRYIIWTVGEHLLLVDVAITKVYPPDLFPRCCFIVYEKS